ncbi:MAG: hypothetical protein SW833_06340 [Cyanobacteriota bacterium]|nr:hypothetical protein [Cyanobacteriota bacterium]
MMTQIDVVTESITDKQWETIHNIARDLVQKKVDANELKKAIAYFRATIDLPDAKLHFSKYLKTLACHGAQIGHSDRTPDYYRNLEKTYSKYLANFQGNANTILQILGWVSRLMLYYKAVGSEDIAVLTEEPISARQAEIKDAIATHNLTVGQVLDAKIAAIKGNKVTYQVLDTIKHTQKEPKKYTSLLEGQNVKIEIVNLREDGKIKKVKLLEPE